MRLNGRNTTETQSARGGSFPGGLRQAMAVFAVVTLAMALGPRGVSGQATTEADLPKFVKAEEVKGTFAERLQTKISLDVRDMGVIDIVRFLALKGDLNIVTAASVQGRATFYLKSVTIQDALDIAVISSRLAYVIENEIIRVMTEGEYESVYGKSFSDRRQVEIVQLNYVKPRYALTTLEGIKSKIGQVIIDEETGSIVMIDTPESLAKMKDALGELETPMRTYIYELQYAKADILAERLKTRIDGQSVGQVVTDTRTNKLIVHVLPGRWPEIEATIKSLDAPTREVLVEARVMQVVFKPQMDYGIDWSFDFRKSSFKDIRKTKFQNILLNDSAPPSSSNLATQYARLAVGTFNVSDFEMAIRALKQVQSTKILSNPKLLVTNNEEAKIHVGDTIPYIISTTSGTGDNAITSEDVRFTDVGLKLNVTPTINEDGYVSMVLKPEISTVVGRITSKGGGIPQVNKTMVETTVMVQDGMTVVLGGLKKENKEQTRKGIPILMDIPVIKKFFSSSSENIEATEIVIFITPHIITDGKMSVTDMKGDIKSSKNYQPLSAKDRKLQGPALKLKN